MVEKDSDFEVFWKAYPFRNGVKPGKGDAEKAWGQTKKLRPPLADVLDVLGKLKRCREWTERQGQYAPMAATWLRRKGWLDEVADTRTPPRPGPDARLAPIQALVAGMNEQRDKNQAVLARFRLLPDEVQQAWLAKAAARPFAGKRADVIELEAARLYDKENKA